jgi:replicative DNA helicase
MQDIIMPHNKEVEEGVLAAILTIPEAFNECSDLSPKDFYFTEHQKIFDQIKKFRAARMPFCAGEIAKALGSGRNKTIENLLEIPPSIDVSGYCKVIRGHHAKRRLIESCNAIVKRCEGVDSAHSTLEYAHKTILSISLGDDDKRAVSLSNVYTADRMIESYREYLESLKNNRFVTGFDEIDRKIRGVAGGEVLTIIARAGSFKTALLQNFMLKYTQTSSWGAVFFSIEMPVANVTERFFSMLDGCPGREVEAMFNPTYNPEVSGASFKQFQRDLKNLYVVDARVSLETIPQYIRLIESNYQTKIGVIGIDYMGLMDSLGDKEYDIISAISKGTKMLAKRLNLPIVILSQVSRKGGDGEVEISLDMGRGSGAIEESADVVFGLWTQEKVACGDDGQEYDLILRILKNRKGQKGSRWVLDIDAKSFQFGNTATEYKPTKGSRTKKAVC